MDNFKTVSRCKYTSYLNSYTKRKSTNALKFTEQIGIKISKNKKESTNKYMLTRMSRKKFRKMF